MHWFFRIQLALVLSCAGVLLSPPSMAAPTGGPSAIFDGPSAKGPALDNKAPLLAACAESKALDANREALVACYGQASRKSWDDAISAGHDYQGVACDPPVPQALTDATAKLKATQTDLQKAQKDLSDATIELDQWSKSQETGATQKRIDAAKKQRDAQAAVDTATVALAAAQKDLADTKAKSAEDALAAAQTQLQKFQKKVTDAENVSRSEKEFEALVRDEQRRKSCLSFQAALITAMAGSAQADETEATEAAAHDHAADTLRKSQGTASATTTTSSLIENPGSPDKVAYSILTGLGADSKTTGTQTILNLNLSSLVWPADAERLKQPVWQRNLFVRGAFPLSATDRVSQTGAGATSAGSPQEVSRFSLLLGGSLLDETDTRLPENEDCYRLVTAYLPFPQQHQITEARSKERARYYDVCAHISANRTRLAWRAGMGFFTPNNVDTPKTRPELAVGAIVWGPSSQVYFNFVYQGLLKPERIDNLGVGISFAGNVDDTKSGVNAALRVGVDTLFMLNYSHADKSTDWELRLAPTVRGKLFGNSIGTLAVGPRFIGSNIDSPGLLATLALTYDADVLVDSLLTPTSAQMAPVGK